MKRRWGCASVCLSVPLSVFFPVQIFSCTGTETERDSQIVAHVALVVSLLHLLSFSSATWPLNTCYCYRQGDIDLKYVSKLLRAGKTHLNLEERKKPSTTVHPDLRFCVNLNSNRVGPVCARKQTNKQVLPLLLLPLLCSLLLFGCAVL